MNFEKVQYKQCVGSDALPIQILYTVYSLLVIQILVCNLIRKLGLLWENTISMCNKILSMSPINSLNILEITKFKITYVKNYKSQQMNTYRTCLIFFIGIRFCLDFNDTKKNDKTFKINIIILFVNIFIY